MLMPLASDMVNANSIHSPQTFQNPKNALLNLMTHFSGKVHSNKNTKLVNRLDGVVIWS